MPEPFIFITIILLNSSQPDSDSDVESGTANISFIIIFCTKYKSQHNKAKSGKRIINSFYK
jgi:hypothetical protein